MSDYTSAGVIVDFIETVAKANAESDAVTVVMTHTLEQARIIQTGMLLDGEEDEEVRSILDGLEDMRLTYPEGDGNRRALGKAIDLITEKIL